MRSQICTLALLVACTSSAPCRADESPTTKPPFRTSHGFSHFVQKYSGLNWLTNSTLSAAASTALSLKTGGLVHAKIRTYGFTDLFDGEFKSVDINAKGGKFNGTPIGDLHVSTTNPFKLHYFQRKGHNSGLRTPLMVAVQGQVTEKQLSHALKSPQVANNLRFLKLDLPGLGEQHLQVLHPKVNFANGKVHVDTDLITAGATKDTGIKLSVIAEPELDKERYIKLNNIAVDSKDVNDPQNFGPFVGELLNPLIDFGRYDRFTHAFRLSDLKVGDDQVNYTGKLLLVPKQAKTPTFSAPFSMAQKKAPAN